MRNTLINNNKSNKLINKINLKIINKYFNINKMQINNKKIVKKIVINYQNKTNY